MRAANRYAALDRSVQRIVAEWTRAIGQYGLGTVLRDVYADRARQRQDEPRVLRSIALDNDTQSLKVRHDDSSSQGAV
jgi:hypothetical protein